MVRILFTVACIFAFVAAGSASLRVERMRVQNMEAPTVDPDEPLVFSWAPASFDRDVDSVAFRVLIQCLNGSAGAHMWERR